MVKASLKEYKKQVDENNLENYVQFPGLVDKVVDVVWDSSVFVLPSRVEGIPNVLMEVLGAGSLLFQQIALPWAKTINK